MNYNDALIEIRKLGNKMQEHADTATRAAQTYDATMQLYNVAASAGDGEAMQRHRETMHNTVDSLLDAGAMIAQITRQQKRISQSVTSGWPRE